MVQLQSPLAERASSGWSSWRHKPLSLAVTFHWRWISVSPCFTLSALSTWGFLSRARASCGIFAVDPDSPRPQQETPRDMLLSLEHQNLPPPSTLQDCSLWLKGHFKVFHFHPFSIPKHSKTEDRCKVHPRHGPSHLDVLGAHGHEWKIDPKCPQRRLWRFNLHKIVMPLRLNHVKSLASASLASLASLAHEAHPPITMPSCLYESLSSCVHSHPKSAGFQVHSVNGSTVSDHQVAEACFAKVSGILLQHFRPIVRLVRARASVSVPECGLSKMRWWR